MTRDQVIEHAKDWLALDLETQRWIQFNLTEHERRDVLSACVDLAFNRTKESLIAYTREREAQFAAHERMLDTIEATLQENIKDI